MMRTGTSLREIGAQLAQEKCGAYVNDSDGTYKLVVKKVPKESTVVPIRDRLVFAGKTQKDCLKLLVRLSERAASNSSHAVLAKNQMWPQFTRGDDLKTAKKPRLGAVCLYEGKARKSAAKKGGKREIDEGWL